MSNPPDQPRIKQLYPYQDASIKQLFNKLNELDENYNLLYQLPTGGGKTVIFSEIARRYIEEKKKKVLILTHRIELCYQTSKQLSAVGVPNKIISSEVKELEDQDEFSCFTAMVETLNNRLIDDEAFVRDIGLVVIDEAHNNSFRKIFRFFDNVNMLGVTATPLSSNKDLPLRKNYHQLIVGESISTLVEQGYLCKPTTFTYSVDLRSLDIGINGDFTVSSSERLYSQEVMQDKLIQAYEEVSKGSKTLIFNPGIQTSIAVYEQFKKHKYPIRHLDCTVSDQERRETLQWFKDTKNGILTSVGILTTGFDEPTVETILLNRATRSLTLYHQMIGRGSRVIDGKKDFNIIDLGNNVRRFGFWEDAIDWQNVFINPDKYLYPQEDELVQEAIYYEMPEAIKIRFPKQPEGPEFNVKELYQELAMRGEHSAQVLEISIADQVEKVILNAKDYEDAIDLCNLLKEEAAYRVKLYTSCMAKCTDNYYVWLLENYVRKFKTAVRTACSGMLTE